MRTYIQFLRDDRLVEIGDVDPTDLLLDYLRLKERSTGTKEGCRGGDCGACTVVLGKEVRGRVYYEPVCSCITLLGTIDGSQLLTVEDLSEVSGTLHPVQDAILRHHGTQCGFCTPGIVMSLFSLYHSNIVVQRQSVLATLSGNLCRCTGYRPIVDAALECCNGAITDRFAQASPKIAERLAHLHSTPDVFMGNAERFFAAPSTIRDLSKLYLAHPDAIVVAGATDIGPKISRDRYDQSKIIHIGRIESLKAISKKKLTIRIGSAVSYRDAENALVDIAPEFEGILRRVGSAQIRARGTLGGAIAKASPVGDLLPLLIALGASMELQCGQQTRVIPIESYFLSRTRQDRRPGEFITYVDIPFLAANQVLRAFKVAKRHDLDRSSLLGAFVFTICEEEITDACIAFGGMAEIPKRAPATESASIGVKIGDRERYCDVTAALQSDYRPISDIRASAAYRMRAAQGILIKAFLELEGGSYISTRLFEPKEAS